MTTLYSRCLVKEWMVGREHVLHRAGSLFLAKTTGRSEQEAIMMAGAMPEASTVIILLMLVPA
jgi:hypothetical protein